MEERGLTSKEAKRRLEKFGSNELPKKKEFSEIKLLLEQIKSPLIYILIIAGIISVILGETVDSVVIFLAVVVNTLLGFFQERKAERALLALKQILRPTAKVIRDGEVKKISVLEIVPGDWVLLSSGERVPADGEVREGVDLLVEEAVLTGEAMPVKKCKMQSASGGAKCKITNQNSKFKNSKTSDQRLVTNDQVDRESRLFMGTTVVGGRGKMLVTKTGEKTEMGRIATSLKTTKEEKTPLQKRLEEFSKLLAIVIGGICGLILVIGLLEGREFVVMFETAVAVAVAAIPEGLVVSLTVILALGMQRILKRKALVRRLVAAETLGSVTVICADKTGTLTQGKMRVVKILPEVSREFHLRGGRKGEGIIEAMVLCNNMINPLEVSMMDYAKEEIKKLRNEEIEGTEGIGEEYPRVGEIPFSSEYKYIATRHVTGDKQHEKEIIFLSGAPEVVISKCKMKNSKLKIWEKKFQEDGKKGYRLVAFAKAEGDQKKIERIFESLKPGRKGEREELSFLGLVLFEDPVRESVKEALEECQRAGIGVKVITGDYQETALAVLNKLKIKNEKLKINEVMTGKELERISEKNLQRRVEKTVLFSRVSPNQKLKIVQALQAKGEAVVMMGDGVNDAPALKKADIGIVVDSATEVAKETADMVLLDSNFATIVAAVKGGRAIFETMKKVITYLLSDSFTEVVLIGGSLLLGLPLPILPGQILWVNLVEDGLPGVALAFEPEEEEVMEDKPRPLEAPILDKEMKILIFVIGLVTDFFLLGLFVWLYKLGWEMLLVRTMIFTGLGVDSLLYVFSCKTFRHNLWHEHVFNNPFLVVSAVIGFSMLLASLYLPGLQIFLRTQPLDFKLWLLIGGLGIIEVSLIEAVKWLFITRRLRE